MGWLSVTVAAGGMIAALTVLAGAAAAPDTAGRHMLARACARGLAWLCLAATLVLAVEAGGWARGLPVWFGLLCLAGPAVAALAPGPRRAAVAAAGGFTVAASALAFLP